MPVPQAWLKGDYCMLCPNLMIQRHFLRIFSFLMLPLLFCFLLLPVYRVQAAVNDTTTWMFTGTHLPPDTEYPATVIGTITGTFTTSSACGVSMTYCPQLSL